MKHALQDFMSAFPRDSVFETDEEVPLGEFRPTLFEEFKKEIGFGSFGGGVLRFFVPLRIRESLSSWTRIAGLNDTVNLGSRLVPFGSNWRGDLFCFDRSLIRGEPRISMLEIGTGELLEVASNFPEFLNIARKHRTVLLGEELYRSWLEEDGDIPTLPQCVGYKMPLFLGGADAASNLGLIDHEIYIELSGQLFSQSSKLAPGTGISGFTIKD